MSGNLQILKNIDELQESLGNISVTISEVKRDLMTDLKQYETTVNNLRKIFLDILKNAILLDEDNPSGYFDIKVNADSNRNQLPFNVDIQIPKADALGLSRLKLVAYDLMVFLNNVNEKRDLPKFLIHDGVYHGISLDTIIRSMNYIYHQFLANPHFQYIVTFNEDEIYVPEEKESVVGKFDFDISPMIVAEFTDNPEGMIFKRDFK